jgi:S1-C subfamily serine protease
MRDGRHHPFGTPVITLLLVALLAAVALLVRARRAETAAGPAAAGPPPAGAATSTAPGAEERTRIAVYRRVSPSVVSVANKALVRGGFFGFQVFEVPQGAGSGFVWDREGHIVSNFHVVRDADAITVTFPDGKSYDARVVGVAPDHDLAVLRMVAPAPRLLPVATGTSHDLQVGQSVLAIGNPFGFDTSLSLGIVSALGRSIRADAQSATIRDLIQTDAAINPGNSGGPLLDSSGRLIGITTVIYSPSGTSAGLGFAVPVDTVNRIVPQLIRKGFVSRAGLGVTFLPDHVARQSGVAGAAILAVPARSPAAAAGLAGLARTRTGELAFGDIVVGIDSQAVESPDDLRALLERFQPGANVTLLVERDGHRRTVGFRLTEEN